jgi:hypothetical protein
MKMTALLLLCLLSFGKLSAQYKAQLNQHSSVVFPSKPQEMNQEGQLILFSLLDADNKVTAMATAIDVSQFGVDSSTIAANYNNSMFIDLILQNIVGQYTGAELVSKKKVAVGRLMGYDVVFKNHPTPNIPYQNIYAHVMFAGSNVYALSVLDIPGSDGSKFMDRFFRSLQVD